MGKDEDKQELDVVDLVQDDEDKIPIRGMIVRISIIVSLSI